MQLTQKQESLIAQYLRDVSRRLDASLPEPAREQRVRQLQARIYRELENTRRSVFTDEDIIGVLRQTGQGRATAAPAPPTVETPPVAPASRPSRRRAATTEQPIWLGVCAYNAERFGIEPWIMRLVAVVLGFITGPIAVLGYLAAFAEFYLASDEAERPTISYPLLALRTGVPFLILIMLRWGGGQAKTLLAYGHEQLLKEPMPPLGKWDWYQHYDGMLFFLALISVVPLAALSGLPLANAWSHSLKRLAQAIVALYGAVLCFGLASLLVGIILDRVQAYLQ